MKHLLALIFSVCFTIQLFSQNKITGAVIQKDNTPVEFVNITLNTKDSVFVKGTATETNGKFELNNLPNGDYLLKISYLGYAPQTIILNGLSQSVDLGSILLKEANTLKEVTVTTSTTTNYVDRLVVFITEKEKSLSTDGINLLSTLNLPQLIVNPLAGTVSLPGDDKVQLCINGVKVDENTIKAIKPNEVIRIEYIDNPGVRYDNAALVINYILKRETSGGTVGFDAKNSVTSLFGMEQATFKLNHKKSEFGFFYNGKIVEMKKVYADRTSVFNFMDGKELIRYDEGIPRKMKENSHQFNLNYNYLDSENYFYATFTYGFKDALKRSETNQHSSFKPTQITNVSQGGKQKQHLPALDLYYARTMKNSQTLIVNLVGTYINSNEDRSYEENLNNSLISDIISNIDGKKYSLIGEGIYEKTFSNKNKLTTGLKHSQAYANNQYTGTVNSVAKMNQAETYAFAQYSGKINKLSYMAGLGASRTWNKQEGKDSHTDYIFRPKFSVQYNFQPQLFVRLKSEISSTNPSLSNLSDVAQYKDTLQITKGNPQLKANLNYITGLTASWNKRVFSINADASYRYSPDAIMADIYRDKDFFITTYNNQKSWQKLNAETTFSLRPLKDLLTISLTGGVNRYWSNGNNYTHTLTNFYYRSSVTLMLDKVLAQFSASNAYDNLWGETMMGGEITQMLMVMYKYDRFTIGGGLMNPISDKYKRKDQNMNKYSSYTSYGYINNLSRMVMLTLNWNFDFGKKGNNSQKRLNNSDRDTGIIAY